MTVFPSTFDHIRVVTAEPANHLYFIAELVQYFVRLICSVYPEN